MESMQTTEQMIKSVTLIVVAGSQPNLDDQVWSAVRGLGNAKCRAEVRLVDPNVDHRPQLVTYQPAPKVYQTLAQALDSTKYQRVVVLDHQAQLSMPQWLDLLSTKVASVEFGCGCTRCSSIAFCERGKPNSSTVQLFFQLLSPITIWGDLVVIRKWTSLAFYRSLFNIDVGQLKTCRIHPSY